MITYAQHFGWSLTVGSIAHNNKAANNSRLSGLGNQNLLVPDKFSVVVGHDVQAFFPNTFYSKGDYNMP